MTRIVSLFALMCMLVACKIQIKVPENGHVITESGAIVCEASQTCELEVSDLFFDETFIAVPDEGYVLDSWQKRDGVGMLCGGSPEPCRLQSSLADRHPRFIALLESDTRFYLEPKYVRSRAEIPSKAKGLASDQMVFHDGAVLTTYTASDGSHWANFLLGSGASINIDYRASGYPQAVFVDGLTMFFDGYSESGVNIALVNPAGDVTIFTLKYNAQLLTLSRDILNRSSLSSADDYREIALSVDAGLFLVATLDRIHQLTAVDVALSLNPLRELTRNAMSELKRIKTQASSSASFTASFLRSGDNCAPKEPWTRLTTVICLSDVQKSARFAFENVLIHLAEDRLQNRIAPGQRELLQALDPHVSGLRSPTSQQITEVIGALQSDPSLTWVVPVDDGLMLTNFEYSFTVSNISQDAVRAELRIGDEIVAVKRGLELLSLPEGAELTFPDVQLPQSGEYDLSVSFYFADGRNQISASDTRRVDVQIPQSFPTHAGFFAGSYELNAHMRLYLPLCDSVSAGRSIADIPPVTVKIDRNGTAVLELQGQKVWQLEFSPELSARESLGPYGYVFLADGDHDRKITMRAGNPAEGTNGEGRVVRVEYSRDDYTFVFLARDEEYPSCYDLGASLPPYGP